MADNTKIEWADATLNFINGCEVVSPGCTNCYAMRLAGTRMRLHPSRKGLTQTIKGKPVWNGHVTHNLKHLFQPLTWRRPRRIFWNAHGDMFLDAVPTQWIDMQFAIMAVTPQHTHMILTKRSKRMRAYLNNPETPRRVAAQLVNLDLKGQITGSQLLAALANRAQESDPEIATWPVPNVWVGVSVEDQDRDIRIGDLKASPAAIRFISFEPLLGPITADLTGIYWVIVGGESGPRARPMHPHWARSLRDQCAAAGVAFFFKQWGEWLPTGSVDIYRHGPGKNERQYPSAEGISMLADGRICCRDFSVDEHKRRIALRLARDTRAVDVDAQALADFHATLDLTSGPVNPLRYQWMYRVGKKLAGRLLDGVEHNGMPEVQHG
ncbi:MAG: phage Gp37/Gp68 family protein [Sphingomonadales bacterium]|nr:phage Gp37/Gp68 family protein [Sphingomonadales bacterium]MDE2171229.1 phage Gp37/Gp68 family protein [Sphingomonadales bacterium]